MSVVIKTSLTLVALLLLNTAPFAAAAPASQYIDDASITTRVKAALLDDAQLKLTLLSVKTDDVSFSSPVLSTAAIRKPSCSGRR